METIPESALENFYKMVLKDFVQITEKYITDSNNKEKKKQEKSKIKQKKKLMILSMNYIIQVTLLLSLYLIGKAKILRFMNR